MDHKIIKIFLYDLIFIRKINTNISYPSATLKKDINVP